MNVEKQITYWKVAALSDIETAEILISNGKLREGLFFCHLSIEKGLKAHYVKTTKASAPKTHNLLFLVSRTALDAKQISEDFLGALMDYQMEGRYPENIAMLPTQAAAESTLHQTKDLLQWLIQQL